MKQTGFPPLPRPIPSRTYAAGFHCPQLLFSLTRPVDNATRDPMLHLALTVLPIPQFPNFLGDRTPSVESHARKALRNFYFRRISGWMPRFSPCSLFCTSRLQNDRGFLRSNHWRRLVLGVSAARTGEAFAISWDSLFRSFL